MTDLVGRIEMLAKEKGLTIKALERMAGVGNGAIRRWQTQSPRLDRLIPVAKCLDVSLDYLVSGTGTAAPMQAQCADFPDLLRTLRQEKGLSQKQLALAVGVSPGNIGDWESGKSKPGYNALVKLASALDVSGDLLLGLCQDISDPALSWKEQELLTACRALPPAARLDVLDYALFKLRRRSESPKSGSGDAR